jgi:serine/threonine protein kinase
MADVYVGDDLLLERTVAIKMIHEHIEVDAVGLERFRREAIALAAVTSSHVVAIHDMGFDGGWFLVLQHVHGQTLADEIGRKGPMALERAEWVLTDLLDALIEIHSRGLIHRDIKPSNIMIDEREHVVLLDFGIALDTSRSRLTEPGMLAGTPAYAVPGCLAEPASDVYQVGLLMLFLLTGVDPVEGTMSRGLLQRLPPELSSVARCALAMDPSARFPSAQTMRDALEEAFDEIATAILPRTVIDKRTCEISRTQLLGLLADSQPNRGTEFHRTSMLAIQPRRTSEVPATRSRRGRLLTATALLGIAIAALTCLTGLGATPAPASRGIRLHAQPIAQPMPRLDDIAEPAANERTSHASN